MLKAVRNGQSVVSPNSGPVAQLGARFHGMEEVVGSIPTRSTNLSNHLRPHTPTFRAGGCNFFGRIFPKMRIHLLSHSFQAFPMAT